MDQSTVGGVVVEANDAMLQFPYGASQALVTFGKYSVLGLCCHVWAVLQCLSCVPMFRLCSHSMGCGCTPMSMGL